MSSFNIDVVFFLALSKSTVVFADLNLINALVWCLKLAYAMTCMSAYHINAQTFGALVCRTNSGYQLRVGLDSHMLRAII